ARRSTRRPYRRRRGGESLDIGCRWRGEASTAPRPAARRVRQRPREECRCTVCIPRPNRGSTSRTQDKTCVTRSAPELHAHEIERWPWAAEIEGETRVSSSLVVDCGDEIVPELLVHEKGRAEHDAGELFRFERNRDDRMAPQQSQ